MDVTGGEIKPLGARRRYDMGSVANQEELAEAHGFGNEGTQRRDRLLEGGTCYQCLCVLDGQAPAQFVVESIVAPVLDLFVQRTLDVIAATGFRAHGTERKSAWMIGIDQFVADRRSVGQDPKPSEGINFFERLD